MMERLLVGDICVAAVVQAIRYSPGSDPWAVARDRLGALPPEEWERRRRLGRRRLNRVDTTHPPSQFRADLLVARPAVAASVTLGEDRCRLVDEELAAATHRVTERARESIRRD